MSQIDPTCFKSNWSLVIFAARETPDILIQTVEAALNAVPACTTIDVLVNGNRDLMDVTIAGYSYRSQDRVPALVKWWFIPWGDKANAWNQYIHSIWAGQELAFFVDGYVQVKPDAIKLLGRAVMGHSFALGGTGVPTTGRSAAKLRRSMLKNGGLHGNLCCIKGQAIRRMRESGIRLPVGLYRTDALMETFMVYDFGPDVNVWNDLRVLVHPDATWSIARADSWGFENLKSRWNRVVRQSMGELEKAAFKDLFVNRKVGLPLKALTVRQLVETWLEECPDQARKMLLRHPLSLLALRKLKTVFVPTFDQLEPVLCF